MIISVMLIHLVGIQLHVHLLLKNLEIMDEKNYLIDLKD